MTNSEVHRQFYLEAAGIRMWYAKKPLPGAAPSPEFWFPEEEIVEAPIWAEAEPVQAQPAQKTPADQPIRQRPAGSVNLQALMDSPGAVKESEPLPTRSASTTLQETSKFIDPLVQDEGSDSSIDSSPEWNVDVALVQTHLGFWATDRYLLVSQWSDEASEQLQDLLANNMLRALGEKPTGERRNLKWPVFRSPGIPGNSPRDFQDVLARVVSADSDKSVILLGVVVDQPDNQRSVVLTKLLTPQALDFPHSLAVLSTTPSYKRDLWCALKARFLR